MVGVTEKPKGTCSREKSPELDMLAEAHLRVDMVSGKKAKVQITGQGSISNSSCNHQRQSDFLTGTCLSHGIQDCPNPPLFPPIIQPRQGFNQGERGLFRVQCGRIRTSAACTSRSSNGRRATMSQWQLVPRRSPA